MSIFAEDFLFIVETIIAETGRTAEGGESSLEIGKHDEFEM